MNRLADVISWVKFCEYSIRAISEDNNISELQKNMMVANCDILKDVQAELSALNRAE